jgi:hypothetical protein
MQKKITKGNRKSELVNVLNSIKLFLCHKIMPNLFFITWMISLCQNLIRYKICNFSLLVCVQQIGENMFCLQKFFQLNFDRLLFLFTVHCEINHMKLSFLNGLMEFFPAMLSRYREPSWVLSVKSLTVFFHLLTVKPSLKGHSYEKFCEIIAKMMD